jgi:hypothetical protein
VPVSFGVPVFIVAPLLFNSRSPEIGGHARRLSRATGANVFGTKSLLIGLIIDRAT